MKLWQWFWFFSVLIAASTFAAITVLVAVKGFRDLIGMFRRMQDRIAPKTKT